MSAPTTDAPQTAGEAIAALDALDSTGPAPAPTPAPPAAPTPPAAPVEADGDDDADPEGAEELGDKGKQALDRMKEKLRSEREKRQAAEARLRDALPQDDAARIAHEAEAKALAKANARILAAEVRAAAAGKLADPADALAFVDLSQFEVDDDGSVDQAEIADAIADLIARKPHLAAQGGPRTPKADPSQGAVGGAPATAGERFAAQFSNF